MLLAQCGAALTVVGLTLALFAGWTGCFAGRRADARLAQSARRALYGATAAIVAASAALASALLTHDFAVAFVSEHTDRSLSWPLALAAFYGGQEGSLLYWTLLLLLVGSASVAAAAHAEPRLVAYATACLATIASFFLVVLAFVASPFDVLGVVPADGFGLNPVLRDGGMLIHPPFLLAGFSAFAVPFSFAAAALLAGGQDAAWIALTRRVALVAWGLQSAGLTLGMWWAYHVLGWGGYWGWDPVENVALLPWLATTAFLHSAQVYERSGRFRGWTFGLVISAFLLSVFGTFIVRSGVLPSVHTFAVSALGPWFFGFLAASVFASGALLAWRGTARRPAAPAALRGPRMLTRESAFLVQNFLVVALLIAVMWGTMLPLVTGLVGRPMVVSSGYYERVAGPLLVLLLALLAAGPLLPWAGGRAWVGRLRWPVAGALATLGALLAFGVRQPGPLIALPLLAAGALTSLRQLARAGWPAAASRRRYGAYLAHLGLAALAAGVTGSHFWQQERQITLRPGEAAAVAGYRLVYEGPERRAEADRTVSGARLRLGADSLTPARVAYAGQSQQVTRVAIRSTPVADLYAVLAGLEPDGTVTLRVFVNPMVTWIWAGAALLVGGVLLGNLGPLRPVMQGAPTRHVGPVIAGEQM